MGEVKYSSSLTYLAEELCISSMTLQRKLMEDNSCQIPMISTTESRLPASFSNCPIESGSDANLLGSDN
ncbi:hypothetical protein BHE74_00015195 [Ensete ventricosum]|nr:hypothetical protein BHE74_00015195 [Ensete ventricosum]